jgi:nucleotidyltransferase/DNA polymerase involved in DNA repair
VKELVIQHADPAADAEALKRLAVWALRYSPIAAADAPDALVIDATGASHLQGGENALLRDAVSRPEAVGISARAAMAQTWGAAHAAARFAARSTLVLSNEESTDRIKALPIAALRLPPGTVTDLRKLGFERIADLMAAPQPSRFSRPGPTSTSSSPIFRCRARWTGLSSPALSEIDGLPLGFSPLPVSLKSVLTICRRAAPSLQSRIVVPRWFRRFVN